jgi:hypothetical protein
MVSSAELCLHPVRWHGLTCQARRRASAPRVPADPAPLARQ